MSKHCRQPILKLLGPTILLILFSLPAFAKDCEEGSTNKSELLACLYDQSESEVRAVYDPLYAQLKHREPSTAQALAKSQRSWEKFAKDSCDFYILFKSDGIPTDVQVNCRVDFSRARIKVLQAWQTQLDRGL